MDIYKFFDPHNFDHLRAYRTLENTGNWPVGFIPDHVVFPPHWQFLLRAKMAREWVALHLDESP